MSTKLALLKYVAGYLDVHKVRRENGEVRSVQVRRSSASNKPPHPSVAKGKALNSDAKADSKRGADAPVNSNFTAKEDARILEWKAANKNQPWKLIADELGKSAGAVKERFKELKGGTADTGTKAVESGKEKAKAKGSDTDGNTEKQKKSEVHVDGKSRKGKALFDADETDMIRFLLKEDEEDKWLRIASRFFDKTGRAVHAEDLKETFAKK